MINSGKSAGRQPTLKTIKMISQIIKNNNGTFTKTELWKNLPKKMMYQTYKNTIDYLESTNQIITKDKKLIWINYPEIYKKLSKQSS